MHGMKIIEVLFLNKEMATQNFHWIFSLIVPTNKPFQTEIQYFLST